MALMSKFQSLKTLHTEGPPNTEHEEVSVCRSLLSIAVRGFASPMHSIWSTTKFAVINATCNGKPGLQSLLITR